MDHYEFYETAIAELKHANRRLDQLFEGLQKEKLSRQVHSLYYSMKEASCRANKSERTLRRYVNEGLLHPMQRKKGCRYNFLKTEIDAL